MSDIVELTINISAPAPSGYGGPNGTCVLVDVERDKLDGIEQEFRDAVWAIIEKHNLPRWEVS